MPFCPTCRVEYLNRITRCEDCDVPLLETLPSAPLPKDTHRQELPSFNTEAEASWCARRSKTRASGRC